MYLPAHFEEKRVDVMHQLIRAHPLATIVTQSAGGLNANHVPLLLDPSPAPFGALQGHVARTNPMLDDLAAGTEALVIFHGPSSYISPSWYPAKQETGKVVPTWNYAVVHAYGVLRARDDAAWVRAQLEGITVQNESALPSPWAVSDAPPEFIEKMMKAIVGVEMIITRIVGKWKMSQNHPTENRAGVVAGLHSRADATAHAVARLVDQVAKPPR